MSLNVAAEFANDFFGNAFCNRKGLGDVKFAIEMIGCA